jgi:hypothetical protein
MQWTANVAGSTPRRTPAVEAPRPARPALRYLKEGSLALRGPHTGRVYSFDAAGEATAVDPKDLEVLLRTRLFEIVER